MSNQEKLFDETGLSFSLDDMDAAYAQGIEDLADRMLELIWQSDYTVALDELEEFLITEKESA